MRSWSCVALRQSSLSVATEHYKRECVTWINWCYYNKLEFAFVLRNLRGPDLHGPLATEFAIRMWRMCVVRYSIFARGQSKASNACVTEFSRLCVVVIVTDAALGRFKVNNGHSVATTATMGRSCYSLDNLFLDELNFSKLYALKIPTHLLIWSM